MNSWKYWQVSVKKCCCTGKTTRSNITEKIFWKKNNISGTTWWKKPEIKRCRKKLAKYSSGKKTFWKNTDKHKMQEKMNKIQFWKKHPGKKCIYKHKVQEKNQQNAILEKTFWKNTDKHKMQEKMNKIQFWKKHPSIRCRKNQQNAILEKTFWKKLISARCTTKNGKMQFWKKHSGKNKAQEIQPWKKYIAPEKNILEKTCNRAQEKMAKIQPLKNRHWKTNTGKNIMEKNILELCKKRNTILEKEKTRKHDLKKILEKHRDETMQENNWKNTMMEKWK